MPRPMIFPRTFTPMPATGLASMRSNSDVTSSTAENVVGYRTRCFHRNRQPATATANPTENTEWRTPPRTAKTNNTQGATAMASWLQYDALSAPRCSAETVAVALSTLQCSGAPPSTDSNASMRRATSGCDDSFSSVLPHGFMTSHRMAATARLGSLPDANAADNASASRWSKMPITFMDRPRMLAP